MSLVLVMLTHPMNCHPEAAESPAKRATPNEGSLYFWKEARNRVPHFSRSLREVG